VFGYFQPALSYAAENRILCKRKKVELVRILQVVVIKGEMGGSCSENGREKERV
jgi:hypothetical protein